MAELLVSKSKALQPFNIKDLNWAAGFLEGEGHFDSAGTNMVVCSQVQREPLDRLIANFGGSLNLIKRKDKNPKHNDIYTWWATGARARGICLTLYNLMSPVRQEQIKRLLAKFKGKQLACRNGHERNDVNARPNRKGKYHSWECRICNNANHQKRRAARKSSGSAQSDYDASVC